MAFSLRRLVGLDHSVPRTPAKRPRRTLLRLERLEERDVPAFLVTTLADAGAGSLRAAITAADAAGGTQQINFQAGLSGTITLESALPDLSASITIAGPGNVTVSRDTKAGAFRIFTVDANTTCAISGLSITYGLIDSGDGGGLQNQGNLTLTRVTFYDNQATNTGGDGGAIANEQNATLTATNCMMQYNNASANGGAVYNQGSATFSAATLYGNTAGNAGGGFYNGTVGTLLINSNSYVNGNSASQEGGGVANFGQFTMNGGEIFSNSATGAKAGVGGGVSSDGPADGNAKVTLTGVDIEDNNANKGGGLYLVGQTTSTTTNLTDCTISNNSAPLGNGIAFQNGATYTLTNCTVTDQIVQDS